MSEIVVEEKDNEVDLKGNTKNMAFIAAFAAFSYFVFAPIEYYFSNKQEVWYDLYDILPLVLLVGIATFVVMFLVGVMIRKSQIAINIYGCIISSLTICLYVQGNYILVPYGVMNGEKVDWSKYAGYNLSSVVVWMGIICLCMILFVKKWKEGKAFRIAKVILGCLVITELVSLCLIGIQNGGYAPKRELKGVTEGKWDYSDNKNMCILLLDTMDSRVLENTLKMYDSPQMREYMEETFSDFTYYRDTMGAFSLTDYAIPQILSGISYYGGNESYNDYIERAYSESPFLNKLRGEDWNMNIHSSTRMPQKEGAIGIANLKLIRYRIAKYGELLKNIYGLVTFRYFPTPLKEYVYCDGIYLNYTCSVDTIDGEAFQQEEWYDYGTDEYWDNNLFFYGMENINKSRSQNTFHFYHLKGIHAIRDVDTDFQLIVDDDKMYSPEQESVVVIRLIENWLLKLKEEGLYDDSVIVIMGDHGNVNYDNINNFGQAPILMVKGYEEKHDFTISEVPMSYNDLQEVFGALVDGCSSRESVEKILAKENLSSTDYDEYAIDGFMDVLNSPKEEYEKTGRTRYMVYHFFAGTLGDNNTGDEGFELYTEYPTYDGEHVESTGKIYK